MRLPTTWPVIVRSGSASVRIYRVDRSRAGRDYSEFRVAYYDAEHRRRVEFFSEFPAAMDKARAVVGSITRGESKVLTLDSDERLAYLRAREAIKDLGISVDAAVSRYAEAQRELGSQSLIEAVRFYRRNCGDLKPAKVRDVLDELIRLREQRTKQGRPASEKYLADLRARLGKFSKAFNCEISKVTPAMIDAFVGALGMSGCTRHNYLRLIKTLFKFAQTRRYYPRTLDPFEGIEMAFDDDSEIEIFTPLEFNQIVKHARPELIPFLTIGAFAGLRHAEITRLDWHDIKPEFIEVTKGKAKTRSRRLVPIQPNLKVWLEPYRQVEGPVVAFANVSKQLTEVLSPESGVKWKHNGLRHSFISYRMACEKNENLVASEAGNTAAMIHRHYRELVTEEQARDWFAVMPETRC